MTTSAQRSTTLRLRLVDGNADILATVSTLAASLRTLEVGGVALIEPTSQVPQVPGMAGAVLVPWPNRVEDAVWWHDGQLLRLPVNEPDLGNAIHGLLTQTRFEVREHGTAAIELHVDLDPQPGYPFALEVTVGYSLRPGGLNARIEIVNRSTRPAPVAVGAHPYLRLGSVPLEDLEVTVDADRVWPLDARNLPGTPQDVRGTDRDPRLPHLVADAPSHVLYQHSRPGRGGLVHSLRAKDGRSVELRTDASLPWTQWYVAPDLMTDEGPRRALAIEPMSAPPNALRSGASLCRVPPGGRRTWGWSIGLRQPASRTR